MTCHVAVEFSAMILTLPEPGTEGPPTGFNIATNWLHAGEKETEFNRAGTDSKLILN